MEQDAGTDGWNACILTMCEAASMVFLALHV